MTRWQKARSENKPFKPKQKSIDQYEVRGDISVDMANEKIDEVLAKVQGHKDTLDAGSYYLKGTFLEKLKRIWHSDTIDVDGNPEKVVLVRQGAALKKHEAKMKKE